MSGKFDYSIDDALGVLLAFVTRICGCFCCALVGTRDDHAQQLVFSLAAPRQPHFNTHLSPQQEREKEREDAETRRLLRAALPRLDFSSQWVVLAVTSVRESTPPAWELELLST